MSSTEARSNHASSDAAAGTVDMHLEVQIIPVSGVDRSKQFYQRLGWRLDADVAPLDGLRIFQFTPPGSAASVTFGTGLTTAAPGSAEGGLIVAGIDAARGDLVGRGIDASEIWHGPPFPAEARQPGPDPAHQPRVLLPPSPTRTATLGWSRRSPRGCPAAPTPRAPPFRPQRTWPARCGGPRWPTARMRSARGGRTCFHRPGHDGDWPGRYAASWWPSGPGRTCQRDRFWPRPRASRVQHRGNVATVDTSSVSGG
jgi:catechol 2,3-dioxygenase-like lactoylglutathione lyase family enzyme